MSNPPGPTSRDGWQWTPKTGLQQGIPSLGVIQPPTKLPENTDTVFDVMIIGGGYTGITTARDLTLAGHKVLLVEARDRIGGRSWSSNIDGYPYEMGGTWVHWTQPFVWRELHRYRLTDQLEVSMAKGHGYDRCVVNLSDRKIVLTKEEEDKVSESSMLKLLDVDGQLGKSVIPLPHNPTFNTTVVAYWDKLTIGDRLNQISDHLSPLERNVLEGFLSITCGGLWENASFFEILRWWALSNYNYADFIEMGLTYKLRCGQSRLARSIFDEANKTSNLFYAFSSPVASVADKGTHVTVTIRSSDTTYSACRLVATIPLNVLHTVKFTPPLLPTKLEASKLGHVNHISKVHAELNNPELRTLSAFAYPHGKLTYTFGDGTTPAGYTHLVAFGSSLPGVHLQAEEDMDETLQAWRNFTPGMDIRRVVFHNWHKDEFARGAWLWLRPGMTTKHLAGLRERQGNVLFASADWAHGWRGFIDGAIEDGGRVAKEVADELQVVKYIE